MKTKSTWLLFLCLSIGQMHTIFGQQLLYNSNGKHWISGALNPPKKFQSKHFESYWGVYFWEFPDGNYEIFNCQELPYSNYSLNKFQKIASAPMQSLKQRDGTTKLYLAPFYSADKAKLLTGKYINAQRPYEPDPPFGNSKLFNYPDIIEKRLSVQYSSKGEIVMGHDLRVAVRYRGKKGEGGHLLVLYGANSFTTASKRLLKVTDESTYFGERKLLNKEKSGFKVLPAYFKGSTQYDDNQYEVYTVKNMKEDIQSFFFTLSSSAIPLNASTGKKRLFFKVIWIPDGKNDYADEKQLWIKEAYDPNNIVAPRTAYINCRCSKNNILNYKVNFENKGNGFAYNVAVKLPINEGFDPQSFEIKSSSPKYDVILKQSKCDDCLLQTITRDTVRVDFKNIGLPGKQNWFHRKKSRGSLSFSIQKSNGYHPKSIMKGFISFSDAETVGTGAGKTRWRQRSFYVKSGYAFRSNQPSVPDSLGIDGYEWQPFNFSVGFQNAPIGSGLLWGLEVGTSQYRFFGDTANIISDFYNNSLFNIRYLDFKANAGYQLTPFFRITGGLGMSIPVVIKQYVTLNNNWNDTPSILEYGYLNKKEINTESVIVKYFNNNPGPVYPKDFGYQPRINLGLQFGVEFGIMHIASLGIENQIRYYPNFYPITEYIPGTLKKSVQLTNLNLCLRIKIPNLICMLRCGN